MRTTERTANEIEEAIAAHDRQVTKSGVEIWIGAEPTFTDRFSTAAEWRTAALGSDKEERARRFIRELAATSPGCVVLRTVGRQYPGESKPRWNFGIYSRRDGQPVWQGPPDPIVRPAPTNEQQLEQLRATLAAELQAGGLYTRIDLPDQAWGVRLLFADSEKRLQHDWQSDTDVRRARLQSQPIPDKGQRDALADRGVYLVAIGLCDDDFADDQNHVQVELPEFAGVEQWLRFIETLGRAANVVGIGALVLTGYSPPVNERVAWTTATPDPGVLEINMAPCPTLTGFYAEQRRLHAAAESVGLSAFQLFFNGEVVDSGGGQHLTFGGLSPETSPFFVEPRLLPRLISYLNRHPSLSYWFAVRSVGSCSQQPRPDEVSAESLDGLSVNLDRLFQRPAVDPEVLWRSLSPFLCDRFGNTHRCEINVEKLWNPYVAGRGCLGLAELRAFRMMRSSDDAAAVAALMRTLVAWLAQSDTPTSMIQWGTRLHDRFSLPFYLLRDLREVLSEIQDAGFGVEDVLAQRVLDDSQLVLGECDLNGARLVVRQAIDFWPVVGDPSAANQTSRIMDSSTSRIEIALELPASTSADESQWELTMLGHMVPWVREKEADRTVLLRGVRYKTFHPLIPISPMVEVLDPLEFCLSSPGKEQAWRVRLFNWQPDRRAYDGLPKDFEDARQRRSERLVVERIESAPTTTVIQSSALTECCVDLRRIERSS
ncbi:MAG: transglutaminase family protein [Planctomycetaceae bacterium]|nr:transglutaminase family protein [Planctomycetaceae bacterium]